MIETTNLEVIAKAAGIVGGILSVGAFLPQAWRIHVRRSAVDVSLAMYLTIIAACVLWMFYAYVFGSVELFVTNLVIALIAIIISALRVRYGVK
jgi:uncharacterized protein with PQ loop repeat